jgi:hypothetical protein
MSTPTVWTVEATNWLAGAGSDDSQWLQCPVCQGFNNHIARVATEVDPRGDENGDGLYQGTTETVRVANGYRRPALRVDIEGECGHDWTLLLQQHKGALIVQARFERGE